MGHFQNKIPRKCSNRFPEFSKPKAITSVFHTEIQTSGIIISRTELMNGVN